MREFASGATRDDEEGKLDYEGFLNPVVLERYAQYMDKHRTKADGGLRDSDDWQKGIPSDVYMKSLLRHVFAAWKYHRYGDVMSAEVEDALCGVLFNAFGYLYNMQHAPPAA